MCMIDYDPPEFCSRIVRTARKQHRCCECGRVIEPGESYHHTSGAWDGTLNTFKHCRHCERSVQLLLDQCHGFLHCGVEDDLAEHIDPHYPWAMQAARLVIGMRRKWRRFDDQGLMSVSVASR